MRLRFGHPLITIAAVIVMLMVFHSAPVLLAVPLSLEWNDGKTGKHNLPRGDHWWSAYYTIKNPLTGMITAIRYTPDGNKLIISSDTGELALIDINSSRALWKTSPPAGGGEAFVLDTSPDGILFAAGRYPAPGKAKKGDLETDMAPPLEIRDTATGAVVRTFRGFSRFLHYHRGGDGSTQDDADFRKNQMNLKWHKESGYLLFSMTARTARFSRDGRAILIQWANAREDLKFIDRHFQMMEIAENRELWFWQYVNDSVEPCIRGTRNAKISDSIIHAPLVFDEARNRIVYAVPGGEIRSMSLDTVMKSMGIENIHRKPAGTLICVMDLNYNRQPSAISLSMNGTIALVTAVQNGSGSLTIIDINGKNHLFTGPWINGVASAWLSPDGTVVVAAGPGGRVLVWDDAGRLAGDQAKAGSGNYCSADFNPLHREAAASAGSAIIFLSERPPKQTGAPGSIQTLRKSLKLWKKER